MGLRRVRPGEAITSDWANSLVDAIERLGRLNVSQQSGLELTHGPHGSTLKLAAALGPSLLKTGTSGTYPPESDIPIIYPANIQTAPYYDDSSDTNTINVTAGAACYALNIAGKAYIPTGTYLIGFPIGGNYSSATPHFVVVYQVSRMIYGTLSGALTAGGSVSCVVTSCLNGTAPSSPQTIYDSLYGSLTGSSGDKYVAVEDINTGTFKFLGLVCS